MEKVIDTTTGKYQGIETNNGVKFMGIKFGHPRRFKRAVPYRAKDKLNFATRAGTQPMQEAALDHDYSDIKFSEDCLNLDLFTPNPNGKHPIVIEFYGGGFLHGGTLDEVMPWLNNGKVIHIIPNYRLGLFGWANIADGDTNVGLSDQILAIKWVIDNADKFGGDVDDISLVGHSAGGKSIAALMASNSNVLDHIKKVVLFSGSLQTIRDKETSKKVLERFCSDNKLTSKDLFNLTDDGLLLAQNKAIGNHLATNWFGPIIDDDLISDNWQDVLIDRQKRTNFKTLVEAGSNELIQLENFSINELKNSILEDLFGINSKVILKQLPDDYQKSELLNLIGEAMYTYPADRTAQLLKDNGEVYGNYSNVLDGRHGGNVEYLATKNADLPIDQRKNQKFYLQLIMDFIVNGKPYNDNLKYEWPLFDDNQLVMKLDPDDISSVSMISHQWIQNLPWQTYKL
ncbi:carboxylesterase family protein [Companilactobacillus baiquanensis]|uniref:Carboxylic ester hydrolase n=1 Tax=Companilactobacillus baiquanensis TaxID=2486005 RepID=A0ABW1UU25_9LACO|nr:carboxylesterase family protein [Companilactobacillus baiquanensis]